MKKMAHIKDGKVVNVSLWNGESHWNPNEEFIELPTEEYLEEDTGETKLRTFVGIGWDYIDGQFVDNRPQEEDPSEPKVKE